MYRTEMLIAKNMDKIILLDKNVIPNDPEWDEEKFFYYAISTGFALIDRSQIGVDKSWNQYQVLDAGLYQNISAMIELLEWVKTECYDIVGISRQRLGDIKNSETAANAQSATYQSIVITEDLFVKFEEFIQKELQGILDISKIAYSEGKKSLYYSSDMQYELLNLNPDKYCSANLGVFVNNSSKEVDKLNALKAQAQAFAQNGSKPSAIAEILQADNFAKVKATLQRLEDLEAEQMQVQQEGEHKNAVEMEQEKNDLLKEYEAYKSFLSINEINAKADREEQLTYIKGEIDQTLVQLKETGAINPDTNDNGVPDINEIMNHAREREKTFLERDKARRDQDLKQQEIDLKKMDSQRKDKLENEKIKVERERIQVDKSNQKNDKEIAQINLKGRNKAKK